jgi:hypothetical protein
MRGNLAGGSIAGACAAGGLVHDKGDRHSASIKNLTPEQAAAGPPVRVRGVVVCYDAGWHQLYLHDGRETLYFNADDFAVQPSKGDLVEITGKARGTNVLENPKLAILGQTALPAARPLELSDLGLDHGEWVEVAAACSRRNPAGAAWPCCSMTRAKLPGVSAGRPGDQ